jgi:hypothetical protein
MECFILALARSQIWSTYLECSSDTTVQYTHSCWSGWEWLCSGKGGQSYLATILVLIRRNVTLHSIYLKASVMMCIVKTPSREELRLMGLYLSLASHLRHLLTSNWPNDMRI